MSEATSAPRNKYTTQLDPSEQAEVNAIKAAHGLKAAHKMLGIGRHSMERAAGGLTIQKGTAALIRLALNLRAAQGVQS